MVVRPHREAYSAAIPARLLVLRLFAGLGLAGEERRQAPVLADAPTRIDCVVPDKPQRLGAFINLVGSVTRSRHVAAASDVRASAIVRQTGEKFMWGTARFAP